MARRARGICRVAGFLTVATADAAISVAALCQSYGGTRAVSELDFAVGARARSSVCSARTAPGKTTTVEILEGYRRPDSGTVRSLASTPYATARLRPQIGGDVAIGSAVSRPAAPRAAAAVRLVLRDGQSPDGCLDLVGLRRVGRDSRYGASRAVKTQRLSLACARGRMSARSCSSMSRPPAWTRTRVRRHGILCARCAPAV